MESKSNPLNWADEQLRQSDSTVQKKDGIRERIKSVFFFFDEAIILVVIAYLIYRFIL
jgi:hypothetical protein